MPLGRGPRRINVIVDHQPAERPGRPGRRAPFEIPRLTAEPLVAVLPVSHRLATADALPFADIAMEPMLVLPRRTEPTMYEAYRRLCLAEGFEPNVAVDVDQLDAVLAFVAAGLGVTLTPASVNRMKFEGVVAVPLAPGVLSGVTVVWDPERLPPAAAALLCEVREVQASEG
jgi:DNA-binding transcriptional LysR family regulator